MLDGGWPNRDVEVDVGWPNRLFAAVLPLVVDPNKELVLVAAKVVGVSSLRRPNNDCGLVLAVSDAAVVVVAGVALGAKLNPEDEALIGPVEGVFSNVGADPNDGLPKPAAGAFYNKKKRFTFYF